MISWTSVVLAFQAVSAFFLFPGFGFANSLISRTVVYSQTCIFARSPWTQRACNIRGIANIKCVEPGSVDSKGVHLYRYCKFGGLQIDGFDCNLKRHSSDFEVPIA